MLKKNISGRKLKTFLLPEKSADIPDVPELKLVILKDKNKDFMQEILETKGQSPGVYRNALFFLVPSEIERLGFYETLKEYKAYQMVAEDKTLNLSDEQKKEVQTALKRIKNDLNDALRRYYRLVFVPQKEGFKQIDLGALTYGHIKPIDEDVCEQLRSEREILERIAPIVIKERYLKNNDFILTEQLYQASIKTPGEVRVINKGVWQTVLLKE